MLYTDILISHFVTAIIAIIVTFFLHHHAFIFINPSTPRWNLSFSYKYKYKPYNSYNVSSEN